MRYSLCKTMKFIAVLLMAGLLPGLTGLAGFCESPKQVMKGTESAVKTGFSRLKYGYRQGKPVRNANRQKLKTNLNAKNPVTQIRTKTVKK
ncbi:MAG: hypothetical protein K0Q50_1139 [Vampirovibrio sp.]|nr:hypothetical protein [Vampirovibrio sp.]